MLTVEAQHFPAPRRATVLQFAFRWPNVSGDDGFLPRTESRPGRVDRCALGAFTARAFIMGT